MKVDNSPQYDTDSAIGILLDYQAELKETLEKIDPVMNCHRLDIFVTHDDLKAFDWAIEILKGLYFKEIPLAEHS